MLGVTGDQPHADLPRITCSNILDFGVIGPWAPATPATRSRPSGWMEINQTANLARYRMLVAAEIPPSYDPLLNHDGLFERLAAQTP